MKKFLLLSTLIASAVMLTDVQPAAAFGDINMSPFGGGNNGGMPWGGGGMPWGGGNNGGMPWGGSPFGGGGSPWGGGGSPWGGSPWGGSPWGGGGMPWGGSPMGYGF